MGQAADLKVSEIEETRQRLELDLRELEERLPAPLRSAKSMAGVMLGAAGLAFVLRRLLGRRSERAPAAEVVVRIVREDR